MKTSAAQKLLIIGSVWPEPQSSAAGKRMMQLIKLFLNAEWEITFASASARTQYATDLSSMGIHKVSIEINSATFDDFVSKLDPAAVLFDRFVTEEQFGWRVFEACPSALRILDTEDLHCLRRARKKALQQGQPFSPCSLLEEEDAKREIASVYRSDLSLIISDYEMKLLKTIFDVNDSLLFWLPFWIEAIDDQRVHNWPAFEERANFVTIGNFRHAPNLDAVRYTRHKIWPLIRRQLSAAEMHIYGAYPSKKAQELHQPHHGFFIKGRAESATDIVKQARVCLAPLRFGAGLKGKLIEAMECGTPSVTTPVGAEGIAGELDWAGIVKTNPEELAAAAIRLYSNPALWKQAQQRGLEIIMQRFVKPNHHSILINHINELQENIKAHRSKNFTGAMLRHHTVLSSKYMSRWIEAKNS